MNFKKALATGAAAATFLLAATPAFAGVFILNGAEVVNEVFTGAFTGGNVIAAGDDVDGGSITTGNAVAVTEVTNVVNSNDVDSWDGDCDECDAVVIGNLGLVYNGVMTVADTGENVIVAEDDVDGGSIGSGNAGAGSVVTNVVNTNVVDDFGWWLD